MMKNGNVDAVDRWLKVNVAVALILLTGGCGGDSATPKTKSAVPPAGPKTPVRTELKPQTGGEPSVTPLDAYYQAQLDALTRARFLREEIKLTQALQFYRAAGKDFPERWEKSWAEFEKDIIKPNSIKLPELPEGRRYVFDRASGKVMVEQRD